MTEAGNTKDAISRLDDPDVAYDSLTAPATVKQPGVGKEAQHVDLHQADKPYSNAKRVGHTHPQARGQRIPLDTGRKGGIHGWGSSDPEEVLNDQEGVAKDDLLGPIAPESEKETADAMKEATQPDKKDGKTMTLQEYEDELGHKV